MITSGVYFKQRVVWELVGIGLVRGEVQILLEGPKGQSLTLEMQPHSALVFASRLVDTASLAGDSNE